MENKFTPELLEKSKQAKSSEELMTLAKENGIELTEESAKVYFEQIHKTGELADEELDNVSGGCDEDEPTDHRLKISPTDEMCKFYACGDCGQESCNCRPCPECTCGTCLHIRYKSDGTAVCNSLNVYSDYNRYYS